MGQAGKKPGTSDGRKADPNDSPSKIGKKIRSGLNSVTIEAKGNEPVLRPVKD